MADQVFYPDQGLTGGTIGDTRNANIDWWDQNASGFGAWINRINGTEASNQQAAVEAEKQRIFDAEQAETAYKRSLAADNTKYSRQVADMLRAGINPATLSGLNGVTGSSSVSAPAASGVAASTHAPSNWLAAVASVIGAIVLKGKAGTAAKAAAVLSNSGNAVWPNGKAYRNG